MIVGHRICDNSRTIDGEDAKNVRCALGYILTKINKFVTIILTRLSIHDERSGKTSFVFSQKSSRCVYVFDKGTVRDATGFCTIEVRLRTPLSMHALYGV